MPESNVEDWNYYHRSHAFTLPNTGSQVVSPLTGTRYAIGAQFEQGAFGYVFACIDEWGNELVAKVLKPGDAWQETEARAISEGVAMAIARSPNIVHAFDMFAFKGGYFIISERCHWTVRQMIHDENVNTSVWLRPLAKAILNALHWMHVNGIAHCDVHPGNVFLRFVPDALLPYDTQSASSAFKLGDLGLARLIGEMNPEDTFHCNYRPPESIDPEQFGKLDHRSDLYQAGLTLLMFALRREVALSESEILDGRPREMAEAIPHEWGQAIAAMLRRHVEFRPFTALDAWRLLDPLLRAQ